MHAGRILSLTLVLLAAGLTSADAGGYLPLLQPVVQPDDVAPSLGFGWTLDLDVDTLVVGAPASRAAYVFVHDGQGWIQEAKLEPGEAGADGFGSSVAIRGDTAVVGAWATDAGGLHDAGAVFVFVRSGGAWTLQAKLLHADPSAADFLGVDVDVWGDRLVSGTHAKRLDNGIFAGAAYVWRREGTVWTQEAKVLAPAPRDGDSFGASVAISADTLVVGAPWRDSPAFIDAGTVNVYTRAGTTWTHQVELFRNDGERFDTFGNSLELGGDRLLVGAPLYEPLPFPNNDNVGAGFLFVGHGSQWQPVADFLVPGSPIESRLGSSLALTETLIVVGAPSEDFPLPNPFFWEDPPGENRGSAHAWTRLGDAWRYEAKLNDLLGSDRDGFGSGVAIRGAAILVGVPGDDATFANAGSVHVLDPLEI